MNNIENIKFFLGDLKASNYNLSFIESVENLIQENKELNDTLKQTQDSWYEDTKKIELNNECEIALNNRILDLEQENKELKEENNKLKTCDGILDVFSLGKESSRQRIEFDYIPKSKVKEKIEELEKEEKQELKGLKGQDRYFIKQIYQAKRIVLEKLLEEGE